MSNPIVIPPHLTSACAGHPERERWLADLPESIDAMRRRWSLELGPRFEFGICSWVAPATRADGTRAVLKMAMPHMEGADEGRALRFWNGDPTVLLLDADARRHALLLERCEPGTSLRAVPEDEQDVIVAGLLKRMWRVPPPDTFRTLAEMIRFWSAATRRDESKWPDRGLVEAGLEVFAELSRPAPTDVLLATDLHAGNVLAARRERWLAIDPKPFVGDRAYDATQHLFNCEARMTTDPLGLVRRFADLLEVDAERVRLWTFARLAAEPRDAWKPPGPTLAALAPFGPHKVRPRRRDTTSAPAWPDAIRRAIGDARTEPVRVGRSNADVWRVDTRFYLKASADAASVEAEAARLDWLAGRVAVPRRVAFGRDRERAYLLTDALPGVGAHAYRGPPQRCVELLAEGLRAWHRLPVDGCPFDAQLAATIARARANVEAGLVDETDFDADRIGRSARDLLAELERTRPAHEDLVVVHGDYCLPNVVLDGDRIGGFVDVGRAGVADRYRDLALAARSIEFNIGAAYVAPFFRAYGVEPDPDRIAFYRLLDEFF